MTGGCPYCPRPLPPQPGRVTCGDPVCHRRHRAMLQAGYHAQRRARINARRQALRQHLQDGRTCVACGEQFYVRRQKQTCCARPRCRNHVRELRRAAKALEQAQAAKALKKGEILDLRADQIDALLDKMAAHRRATRSWLRIEDPWAQKPGSALHQSAVITHSIDLEGAMR